MSRRAFSERLGEIIKMGAFSGLCSNARLKYEPHYGFGAFQWADFIVWLKCDRIKVENGSKAPVIRSAVIGLSESRASIMCEWILECEIKFNRKQL